MNRESKIIEYLNSSETGLETKVIASALHISRENTSRILNSLVKKGIVEKYHNKPVLYKLQKEDKRKNRLSYFEELNPSLAKAISQAKSSVLYPPNGINTLILGETGVGKSYFAQVMYDFAIESNVLHQNAPFTVFNCSDYSQNPEMLMGILFGVKKGAYTGADKDKKGLIEVSDGGVLFLDEIHNLPQEGQEMLFTFFDRGIFRRLGESEGERTASVRIIGATSEAINSSLVGPFRRRMPMMIELPNLDERSEQERASLVELFFEKEAKTLHQSLFISKDVFISLLYYHCPQNVGQLKSDIQLLCAKAYAEYLLEDKDKIEIRTKDLPSSIARGLLENTSHRLIRNETHFYSREAIEFSPKESSTSEKNTIYALLSDTAQRGNQSSNDNTKIKILMEKEISDYFFSLDNKKVAKEGIALEKIIEASRLQLIEEIIAFVYSELKINWDGNIRMGFILHLHNLIERAKNQQNISADTEEINISYQINHKKEFSVALKCLEKIAEQEHVHLPFAEVNNLVSFFLHSNEQIQKDTNVQVLVIAHGDSTATSMAKTVNELLGNENVVGIDAPLNEKPIDVMKHVVDKLKVANQEQDVLCLVDMGSFTQISDKIEKEINVHSVAVPLVSTLHVLEASRKASLGNSLASIYNDLLKVDFSFFGCCEQTNYEKHETDRSVNLSQGDNGDLVILTCCLTGHGTAKYLKDMLEKSFDGNRAVQFMAIQLVDREQDRKLIEEIGSKNKIVAIISTFDVNYSCPQFDINDVVNGDALKQLHQLVNTGTISRNIRRSLANELEHVNGATLFDDILDIDEAIKKTFQVQVSEHELIGVIMHTSVLIDNLKGNKIKSDNQETPSKYQKQIAQMKEIFYPIEKKYGISLTNRELFYIFEYYFHLR